MNAKKEDDRMIGSELVDAIAKEAGLTKKDTRIFLRAFIKVVFDTLKQNRQIYIRNLGYFFPKMIKERHIENPFKTGTVEAHTRYCFSFTDTFIKQLNGKK